METLDLSTLTLDRGAHKAREDGVCLLEAVAWFAGEEHSATPSCVSTILSVFGMHLNDSLPDDLRPQLVPLIPKMVGTADDGLDYARYELAYEWFVHDLVPTWFCLAGLYDHGNAIANLVIPSATHHNEDASNIAFISTLSSAAMAAANEVRSDIDPTTTALHYSTVTATRMADLALDIFHENHNGGITLQRANVIIGAFVRSSNTAGFVGPLVNGRGWNDIRDDVHCLQQSMVQTFADMVELNTSENVTDVVFADNQSWNLIGRDR